MSQPETPIASVSERTNVMRNAALAGAVICPLVMLLPPRKLDLRNTFLAGVFLLSTNQLSVEYTGTSLVQRFSNRVSSITSSSLPEKAQRTSELIREAREREAAQKNRQNQYAKEEEDKSIAKAAKKAWMGGEPDDWVKRRAEEHQKALEEGQGISDIIINQITDVLSGNWGGKAKVEEKEEGEVGATKKP